MRVCVCVWTRNGTEISKYPPQRIDFEAISASVSETREAIQTIKSVEFIH